MFKLNSIVKALLVALALVGATSVATAATPPAESGDAWYYKHTGGVAPN
jgi:hypothetical protein